MGEKYLHSIPSQALNQKHMRSGSLTYTGSPGNCQSDTGRILFRGFTHTSDAEGPVLFFFLGLNLVVSPVVGLRAALGQAVMILYQYRAIKTPSIRYLCSSGIPVFRDGGP